MYLLSLNNIDRIRSDIYRQRVSYSHLSDDLVDHVCCDIEAEMSSGLSFEEAYARVKERIGINRFKKIQEETLLLIDKNYKSMKTFMKVFGVLSPSLLAIAALFKIQHWPGAGIMLVLGFFFLCFFFLPSSVYVLYTENKTNKKHLLMRISGLISTVLFLLGILFKVQHWPGASILLLVGMVMAALVFLPSLVTSKISDDKGEGKRSAYLLGLIAGLLYIFGFLFKIMHWPGASVLILLALIVFVMIFLPTFSFANFRNEQHVKGKFIFLVVVVLMAVLTLTMMSLSVSKDMLNEFVVIEDQMDEVLNDLTIQNTKLSESLAKLPSQDIDYASISNRTIELDSWIADLKREIVRTAEPEGSSVISDGNIDCSQITRKDDTNTPAEIMIVEGKAYQLSEKMVEYKKLLSLVSQDPDYISDLELLLDVSEERVTKDWTYDWESINFEHRTLISVINSLTTIQIKIRLAEKECLKILSSEDIGTEASSIALQTGKF